MARIITCTNEDGLGIRFGYTPTPWLLEDVEGIYIADANVYTSENTMIDGSTYQGTTLKMRNIVMTMSCQKDYQKNRQMLYDVFKPKAPGVFSYSENGETRTIEYYPETVEISTMEHKRTATVSLLCPDSYFQAEHETIVMVAGWSGGWEFKHEFKNGGEPFGEKSDVKLKEILNDSAADNIGMTIRITTTGNVTNPSVTRIESQQTIQIGNAAHPMQMKAGDEIIITTDTGNKHVYLIRDGVKNEINNYLDEDSEFIQLMRGKNTIGYNADSGAEYVNVSVEFRLKFLGV